MQILDEDREVYEAFLERLKQRIHEQYGDEVKDEEIQVKVSFRVPQITKSFTLMETNLI